MGDAGREREAAEAVERSETSAEVGGSSASGSRSSNKMEGEEEEEKEEEEAAQNFLLYLLPAGRGRGGARAMHDQVEFAEEVTTEYVQRADVLITHTAVYDTLHAEPLNSVHDKEVAGYMDQMIKFIRGEGDHGEHAGGKHPQERDACSKRVQ